MIYELYIDKLFFLNFMMNFYLLSLTNTSAFRRVPLKKIALGALIGTLGFLVPLCLPWHYVVRIAIGMIMNCIGMLKIVFPQTTGKYFFFGCEKLAIYSFIMGGALMFVLKILPESFHNWIFVILTGGVICLALMRYRIGRSLGDNICQVDMKGAGGEVSVKGFFDTGNGLFEPISGKPVCVVDGHLYSTLCDEDANGFRIIPYTTIGKKRGVMHASLVEWMEIRFSDEQIMLQNVYIASGEEMLEESDVPEAEQVRIILHPKLMENKNLNEKKRKVVKYDFQDNVARKNPAQPDT